MVKGGGEIGGFWRRLARAAEAVAGRPVDRPLALGVPSCPQSRQARPEEAQEPSWGAAKGAR